MKRTYLFTYRCEGEIVARMCDSMEIAHEVGFADCTGNSNFRVFLIDESGFPVELELETFTIPYPHIMLVDYRNGYRRSIEGATWPEH